MATKATKLPDSADEPKEKDKEEIPQQEPLTNEELFGLRSILDRHGFDRVKGKF